MRDRKIRPPIEVGPELPLKDELDFGSIIGVVNVVACVENSHSPWFVGPHGLVIESPIALQRPVPCKGSLGIWRIPDDIRAAADEALPRQGGAR